MVVTNPTIIFLEIFAYKSEIRFEQKANKLSATLEDVKSYFSDTLEIICSPHLQLQAVTGIFVCKVINPTQGIFYQALQALTGQLLLKRIKPVTVTLSKTLPAVTGIFTAKFIYYAGTLNKTLFNVTSNITVRMLYYFITFTPTLQNTTGLFTARFFSFTGVLSGTLMNLAGIIRGGTVLAVYLTPTLNPLLGTFRLLTPILVTITLANNLTKVTGLFNGKVYPVGKIKAALQNITSVFYITLPVPINITLYSYTWPLIPNIKFYAAPSGRWSSKLPSVVSSIFAKIPVKIEIKLTRVLASITASIKGRSLIAGYSNAQLASIYISWYFRHDKPRGLILSAILPVTARIFGRVSTYGRLESALSQHSLTTHFKLKVPLVTDITFNLTNLFVNKFNIFGKVALSGTLDTKTYQTTSRIFCIALIGIKIENCFLTNLTGLFTIKVPVKLNFSFSLELGNATSKFLGRGHHSPILNKKLQDVTANFHLIQEAFFFVLDGKDFNGLKFNSRSFYWATLGNTFTRPAGRYWKLQIYANCGDPNLTKIKFIRLFVKNTQGTLINVLANNLNARDFSKNVSEFLTDTGMVWSYTHPEVITAEALELEVE